MDDLEEENVDIEEPQVESESIPSELEIEPPKNDLYAEGPKKVINTLLKKKKIMLLAAGCIGFFLFIIFLTVFTNTKLNKKPYYETKCEKVTVTYTPYDGSASSRVQTMDIEEYVKKAVYEYTKDFQNPPSGIFQVYYVLAVALRTEIINNNCTITYRDKTFETEVPENEILNSALNVAKSIVLGNEEEELLPVKVTNLCWTEKNEQEYKITEWNNGSLPTKFIYENSTNEIYNNCPCNRPEEELDSCWVTWEVETENEDGTTDITEEKEWLHQEVETSDYTISSYATYYLMLEKAKGYDEILRYFFGNNVKYMTIYDASSNTKSETIAQETNCSTFSLTTTTLTKEEFVSKVENYDYKSENKDKMESWALFEKNAGLIYDIATSNNVNPEMIIVRGILEGFSPGIAKHNYFGITCYNLQPEKCSVYKTFDEGIMGFINVLKKYDSFESFAGRYAYLGDYWYNPGGSGSGGCYYAKEIYPDGLDEYVTQACSSAYRNCHGAGCMPTREEDKKAYNRYQGRNMTKQREKIFGISEDNCTNNTMNDGNCVIFAQGDARWGTHSLGNGSVTIHNSGCALTSIAIAMTCTGTVTDASFTPLVLNDALVANHGFEGALIYWDNDAMRDFAPTFRLAMNYNMTKNESSSSKISKMSNGIKENRIGIVHIKNSDHLAGHFVVLKEINASNNTITSLDPAGGKVTTYSINDVDGFKYYTY